MTHPYILCGYTGKSWVEAFEKCVFEFQYPSKESLLECFNLQLNGYDELDFSKNLRLLNFLCDEALGTTLKIDLVDLGEKCGNKKKARERLIVNKEKEKT